MIETFAGQAFVMSTLKADATLTTLLPGGIHDTPGRDRVGRFATVTSSGSRMVQNVQGLVLFAHEYFAVQVYERTKSWVGIEAALSRANVLLAMHAGGTVSGAAIYSVRRDDGEIPPRVDIEPDGQQYRQAGTYYHLQIQST